MINSTISNNEGDIFSFGGGIVNDDGELMVIDSTIRDNFAFTAGGIASSGTVHVTNSTINDNHSIEGGGIFNVGMLSVANSTITDNSAGTRLGSGGDGGGIYNAAVGTLNLTNITISGNSAARGGGIFNDGTITLTNTILAQNIVSDDDAYLDIDTRGPDCYGSLTDGGHNLLGDTSECSGLTDGVNGNQVGTAANPIDPMLGPLQDNGGPTQTMALLPGSPAVGAGDATTCRQAPINDLDQRGYPRNAATRGVCDIGAYDAGGALYAFGGFNSPVQNPPAVNVVRAGRAIPIKFSLLGNQGLDILAVGSPSSQQVSCGTGAAMGNAEPAAAAGKSGLGYDASNDTYNYVWKTSKSWAGNCRNFTLTLRDGSIHTAAFQFR